MKNFVMLGLTLAAGIAIVRSLLNRHESTVLEDKIHSLQDKFKSLDAQAAQDMTATAAV